jgi:hypothetical protein
MTHVQQEQIITPEKQQTSARQSSNRAGRLPQANHHD